MFESHCRYCLRSFKLHSLSGLFLCFLHIFSIFFLFILAPDPVCAGYLLSRTANRRTTARLCNLPCPTADVRQPFRKTLAKRFLNAIPIDVIVRIMVKFQYATYRKKEADQQ